MSRRTQGDPGSAAGARVDQPKDGIRELVETVAAARERWIRRGYDEAAEILVGLVRRAGGEPTDVEAVAAVVLGASPQDGPPFAPARVRCGTLCAVVLRRP